MDALQAMKTRRSTRKFLKKPVPEQKLEQIVELGRYAPSGGNSQRTHFIVIKSTAVFDELANIVQSEFAKMSFSEDTYPSLVNSIRLSRVGNYHFCYHAPVLIVLTNQKGYGNALADCACAAENIMLAANALDLGSCWINQLRWLDENPAVRRYLSLLGVSDSETVCAAVALGFAESLSRIPLPRTGNPVTVIEPN